jgi:hypothetical protein
VVIEVWYHETMLVQDAFGLGGLGVKNVGTCFQRFYQMYVLNREQAERVIYVSSSKNLGQLELDHLDDQDFGNVHGMSLSFQQVAIF